MSTRSWEVKPLAIDADYIDDQREFSERAFGPGSREEGVSDHIRKELVEVADALSDSEKLAEWVDIIILGFDGAWRTGADSQAIIDSIHAKLDKNKARTWPDWRTAEPGKAIEHDRTVAEPDSLPLQHFHDGRPCYVKDHG